MVPDSTRSPLPCSTHDTHVAILMATYQGERYLAEQLDSLAAQTHTNWTLWVSDDGSTDATHALLARYQRDWGEHRLKWRNGPRQGFVTNFLSLMCDASIPADAIALADQDDTWHADKLARAIVAMQPHDDSVPVLYGTRSCLVDADGQTLGESPLLTRPVGFRNALVQNFASGNTMVMNAAARRLLAQAGAHIDVPVHDWWAYLLISGQGGRVVFDTRPSVYYRQHATNVIGMAPGGRQVCQRVARFWAGNHQHHVQRNLDALAPHVDRLTAANRQVYECYRASRGQTLTKRLCGLKRSGVYRHSWVGHWGMFLATILNKT